MPGKRKKFEQASREVGVEIHRQLHEAIEIKENVLETPAEAAFFAGYLRSFIFEQFCCIEKPSLATIYAHAENICDGVLPSILWDVFQKGAALADFLSRENVEGLSDETREHLANMEAAGGLGICAGENDFYEFYLDKTMPKNLTNYLLGKPVTGPHMLWSHLRS